MLAIEVLVQAVVIVDSILEHKRCRLDLAGLMAALNKVRVLFRIADPIPMVLFQRLAIGTRCG